MVISLVRHGQTAWNLDRRMQGRTDVPLDAIGREQARAAVRDLGGVAWATIVSSPLVRARETAEIIATGLGMELGDTHDEFMEQSFGEAEGLAVDDARAQWPARDYPGGETVAEVGARGLLGLERIAERHPDGDVIIVAHGNLIRATLAAASARAFDDIAILPNCSSSQLEFSAGSWRLLTVAGEPVVVDDAVRLG